MNTSVNSKDDRHFWDQSGIVLRMKSFKKPRYAWIVEKTQTSYHYNPFDTHDYQFYILVKRLDLFETETFEYFESIGVDLQLKMIYLLKFSIENNQPDLTKFFLERFSHFLSDPIKQSKLRSLLDMVAVSGEPFMNLCLEYWADLNDLLFRAIHCRHASGVKFIKFLIENGADGHLKDSKYHIAAIGRGLEKLKVFHESGCITGRITESMINQMDVFSNYDVFEYVVKNFDNWGVIIVYVSR